MKKDVVTIDLGRLPEELKVKLLEFLGALGIETKEKEKVKLSELPPHLQGRKIYYNLYSVTFTADTYEGAITEFYACYSLDKPLSDPEILKEHHMYFYPHHEIIDIEYHDSYERPHPGVAKIIYDPETDEWHKLRE